MTKANKRLSSGKKQEPDIAGMTPEEMSLRGRLGAYALHSRYDSKDLTKAARRSFLDRFEREVDPDRVLPVPERMRRAEMARKAYFTKLALKSAQARRARKKN